MSRCFQTLDGFVPIQTTRQRVEGVLGSFSVVTSTVRYPVYKMSVSPSCEWQQLLQHVNAAY